MRRFGISAALVALVAFGSLPGPLRHAGAVPLDGQDLRGWLVLEAESGYLTNGYLDPLLPFWQPALEAGFVQPGATGALEWSGDRTRLLLAGTARRTEFLDDRPAWQAYLLRGRGTRRLAPGLRGSLDMGFAEGRQPGTRRTVSVQTSVRWVASPGLALRVGPGIATRRLETGGGAEPGNGLPGDPIVPFGRLSVEAGSPAHARVGATSYFLSAGLEGWSGLRWRWEAEAFASHTESADLGLDTRGAGARLRATRWIDGVRLEVGSGVEGFGYRAALEGAALGEEDGGPPESDILGRGDLALGIPLGGRTELRAGIAGVTVLGGESDRGLDWRASAGLRVSLGGSLSRAEASLWESVEDGLRVRIPYQGRGRLYLTGDFNGWRSPGIPLERGPDGTHAVTLRLDPGSYRYLIGVVEEDGSEDWLEFPEGALVVDDGFGGRNGLLVVEESCCPEGREER